MKNSQVIYVFGTIILFIGLLWMFLPHALHEQVLNREEETKHIFHIFQGVLIVVIGLLIMIKSKKR